MGWRGASQSLLKVLWSCMWKGQEVRGSQVCPGTTWSSVQCRWVSRAQAEQDDRGAIERFFSRINKWWNYIWKEHFEIWRIDWKRVRSVTKRAVRRLKEIKGRQKKFLNLCLAQCRAPSKCVKRTNEIKRPTLWCWKFSEKEKMNANWKISDKVHLLASEGSCSSLKWL